jgi:hypothetical protein
MPQGNGQFILQEILKRAPTEIEHHIRVEFHSIALMLRGEELITDQQAELITTLYKTDLTTLIRPQEIYPQGNDYY